MVSKRIAAFAAGFLLAATAALAQSQPSPIINYGSGSTSGGGSGVTSLTGTANQITVSGATGAVTISVPADFRTTTFNKVTLTQPATGATLTITDGKTLAVANTLTFTGTDGSSVAFGTGGTVSYAAGANPSATAGPTAVNGSATTFMRSDAAPAIQKGTASVFGIVEADGVTITSAAGVLTAVGASATSVTVGTTTIVSGTNGRIEYNNAGVLGEMTTTGSGTVVALATSPVFVGPALGTPVSGVATNLTGTAAGLTAGNVTTNANLTGPITSSGNATAIASQTGTGTKFVVDTSPTLVTPVLGVASGTSVTLTGAAPQVVLGANTTTLGSVKMFGNTSGDLTIRPAAVAGTASVLIFPGASFDFSASGGTSQVVKQTSSGGAFTVARLACADLSDSSTGCSGAASAVGANPTGTAGPAAVNGVATTFMRSDAAPLVQKGTAAQFGIVEADGVTITSASGVLTAVGGSATSIIVGTTTIGSGSSGRIEYNNAGVLGEMTTTGSGTVAVLATSPTLVTPVLGVAAGTSIALGGATIGSDALGVTGSVTISSTLASAAHTVTSASATALTVGRLGATTPALLVDASTGTSITGVKIKSAGTGGGVAVSAMGETNVALTVDAAGSGTITIGGTSTGAITLTRATTMSNALTYGGVTLSNAVTGTGNMVLATTPTLTTPVIGAATGTSLSTTGAHTAFNATAIPTGGTAGSGYLFSSTANNGLFFGTGAPTLTAAEGSLYLRNDTGHPYYNSTGSTTWVDLTAGGGGSGCIPAGSSTQILTDNGSGACTSNASTLTSSIFTSGAASASPAAFTVQVGASSRSGTDSNVAGATGTITSGNGTGNATASSLLFKTPVVAASGTGAQTQTTQLTLNSTSATFVPVVVLPAGAAATPALGIGVNDTGFYGNGSGRVYLTSSGTQSWQFWPSDLFISGGPGLTKQACGSGSASILLGIVSNISMGCADGDTFSVMSQGTETDYFDIGIATKTIVTDPTTSATPSAWTFTLGQSSSGSNVAGAAGTIQSGKGTGNSTGSSLIFKTPAPTSSGSGAQTQTTQLTVNNASATFVPLVVIPSGGGTTTGLGLTGDTTTGIGSAGAGNLDLYVSGTAAFRATTTAFQSVTAGSGAMRTAAASGTVPTFTPNKTSTTSGVGADTSGDVSLIAGGTEVVRITSSSFNLPGLTQTSTAQSGTMCYSTAGASPVTYDATLGCLASLEELKDIKPGGIVGALAEIGALKPFWYTWKTTSPEWKADKHEQPGLGAHATEKVDPRLVGYGPDGKLRGVRYAQTVALLIAGMQEQQVQIASLKAENARLKTANDNFDNRLAKLEHPLQQQAKLEGVRH